MGTRLHLEIERCHGLPPAEPMSLEWNGPSCTLGRHPDNDFPIADPDRLISGYHARIELLEDEAWIVDFSTNGTFLNHAPERLPPNTPVPLHDGDSLTIGHYDISVRLHPDVPEEEQGIDHAGTPLGAGALPGLEPVGPAPDIMDFLGEGAPPLPMESGPAAEDAFPDARALDPFLAGPAPADEEPRPAEPRPTPVEHVHFRPPETSPIPDDYDLLKDELPPSEAEPWGSPEAAEPFNQPETPPLGPARAPETAELRLGTAPGPSTQESQHVTAGARPPAAEEPAAPTGPHPRPAAAPSAQAAGRRDASSPSTQPESAQVDLLNAFLKGLGVGDSATVADPAALLGEAGSLLRTLTAGLTTVMMARARFKNELRLGSVTTIRSTGNNPFKFSASPEEALERLLLRPNPAYLHPLDAARESFEDIQAHEMAMIAGLRAALRALLARFEPGTLESRLDSGSGLEKLLPIARKARYWDLFTETFGKVAADASDDFMQLFGEAFTRAYEDQIHRLAEARRQRTG